MNSPFPNRVKCPSNRVNSSLRAGLFVAIALLASANVPHAPPVPESDLSPSPDGPSVEPVSSAEAKAWAEDARALHTGLIDRHAEPFHSVTSGDLESAVVTLVVEIPGLARHEIVAGLARIAALFGDGHTAVPILFDEAAGLHTLPLRLGWYRDGLWVEAADEGLAEIVGGRVRSIGGVPVEEAIHRVTPLISRDNEVWVRVMVPLLLTRSEILHAVDLADDPMEARLEVEREERSRSLRVPALESVRDLAHGPGAWRRSKTDDWLDAGPIEPPLYLRHLDRIYWWSHLQQSGLLYFQLNQVLNAPRGPALAEAFDQMLRVGEEREVEKLVLDLRHNTGGEGYLDRHLVRELVRWTGEHPGGLFVIIGPRVFSAAQALVQELEIWTDATFVGAPTGSSPNFYGDHSFFRLPNSGLLASASPTWWQPAGPYDRRPYLAPDVAAEPVFADYLEGRDPALRAILGWESRFRLEDAVAPAIRGDVEAAESGLRRWGEDPANRYRDPAAALNAFAYRKARELGWEPALPLFRLNVEVHPDRANPWDSLGEALLALGRRDEGLAAYRRAYGIDPSVGRAAEVLREHDALPGEEARASGDHRIKK